MNEEKRMISDYEVISSQRIGKEEIVIAENPKAVFNERFLCCYVDKNEIFESYREAFVGDNFAEMLKIYGERIVSAADTVLKEQEIETATVGKENIVTADMCEPIGWDDSIENTVVAIRSDVLRPEYQRATHQLVFCTGGFGSQPNARGRTCFCTSLYDGKQSNYWRQDILGKVKPENLPEWAKNGLEKARENLETNKKPKEYDAR